MSDIEQPVDQENSILFEEYLQSSYEDEHKEKDLTPEKDQFSSDSDSDFLELQKNEIYLPKTKEQKQKQNEEIVISSCSSTNFLPNFQMERLPTREVTKAQENHYFIDASSLLDESEVTSYTSVTLRSENKPSNSKITKLRTDSCESQEFTTEFEKEIKITNLEYKNNEPSTSYDKHSTTLVNFREINTELPSTSLEKNIEHNFTDLPSSSSDRSYISLNSQLDKDNCEKVSDFEYASKNFDQNDKFVSKTGWEAQTLDQLETEKNYTPPNSHSIEKNNFEKVPNFQFDDKILDQNDKFVTKTSWEAQTNGQSEIETTKNVITWAEKNYASLDSHFLNQNIPKTSLEINANFYQDTPSTSSDNYASLDSHILNKNLHCSGINNQKVSIEDKKSNFVRSGTFELDSDIRKNEKRQGTLIFQNSIHQYSGHNLEPETILMPTTPFNSIIHVNETLTKTEVETERPLDSIFDKVPEIPKSDTIDSLASLCEAQIKREDSVPIISGGILPSDYEVETQNVEKSEVKASKSEVKTAWVVDMSTPPPQKKVFDIPPETKSPSQKSLGFFIDLTEVKNEDEPKKVKKPEIDDVKKNIFSMSIEFQAPKKGMPSRLSQSLSAKKQNSSSENSVKSEKTSDKKIKKSEVNGEQNGTKSEKINLRHKRSNSSSLNRHSWNGQNEEYFSMNHQRTFSLSEKMSEHTSLTIDFKNDVIHLEQIETCENIIENEIPNQILNEPKISEKPKINGFEKHGRHFENKNDLKKKNGSKVHGNGSHENHNFNGKNCNKQEESDNDSHGYVKNSGRDVKRKNSGKSHEEIKICESDTLGYEHEKVSHKNGIQKSANGKNYEDVKNSTGHGNDNFQRKNGDQYANHDIKIKETDYLLHNYDTKMHKNGEIISRNDTKIKESNHMHIEHDNRKNGSKLTGNVENDRSIPSTTTQSNKNIENQYQKEIGNLKNDQNVIIEPQIQVQSISSVHVESTKSQKNQTVIIINHDIETEKPISDGFVSLSDLDKPIPKIVTTEEPVYTRMTRSIPETSWIENKLLMSRSIGCRPSAKLLSNMSTSTPCFSNANQRISSESDIFSELSDFSSIQSSTALEISTEDTSQSLSTHHHSNKLGTDLLRMFLEEISPDLTITVAGRRLRAHKCILSSRCQYFAAMLSGGHVESTGNVISLDGFTFQAVYFAMCHIYSGAADIPESIDLVELATLADMLGLEGLKEVVATTLKLKYCHMFHKPCSVCVVGILETLQLAFTYSLDDLYRKCLKWITRYFVRVWATRAFASLTKELHEKCYQQHVVHMSPDSVLETMLCVDKLLATLPNVRWAEIVTELAERLKDDCEMYLMEHFASVLGSASFLSLGKELNWNISKLEGSFLLSAENLSPEQACRSYTKINKLQAFLQVGDESWSSNFTDLVNTLYSRIESSVVRQAVRIAHMNAWVKLDPYLRTRVQELACIPLEIPEKPTQKTAKHQPRSTSGSRNLDLRQIRLAMQQHTKRATSTESKVRKPPEKRVIKVVQEPQPPRPRTWPAQTLKANKIISSSESSRNSSPAMKNAKNDTKHKTPERSSSQNTNNPPTNKQNQISNNKGVKITEKKVTTKSKVISTTTNPPVKQHLTNSQKTIKLTSKTSTTKVQKTTTTKPPLVTKNSNSNSNVSKSGSNSSNQQSPSLKNRNNLSSSNSTPSQTKSDSNPYSGSPSLRRSLLLAAKAPQVPIKPMSPATNKRLARVQASNSLTSPTKASMAKCVNNQKTTNVRTKSKEIKSEIKENKPEKVEIKSTENANNKKSDKPTVERSGTFLKDEPTVLNKA